MSVRFYISIDPIEGGRRPVYEEKAVLHCSLCNLAHQARRGNALTVGDITLWEGLMDRDGNLMIADSPRLPPRVRQVFKDKLGRLREVCALYWDVCVPDHGPPFWRYEVSWFRPTSKSRYGQRSFDYSWATWVAGAEEVMP